MKDTVFQQLLKPISPKMLEECVKRFNTDYHYERFKTRDHLESMIYAQLHEVKSLRVLEVALNSQQIGMKTQVHRSTISDANAKRPAQCFFWIAEQLMSLAPRKKRKEIKKMVRILDSSPIKLKGRGYDEWAKAYKTAHWQGMKLHTEYDLTLQCPTQITTSFANYNDSTMGQRWPIVPDTIYVFDKGYCDFNWWWSIHQKQAYFVTRLKKNTAIKMQSSRVAVSETILEDGIFSFKNKHSRGGKKNHYEANLRRIIVRREEKEPLILVTNLLDVQAETIAELYKDRWDIELFFKWIKQNLKLKKFLGKSLNAVKIQLATAIITYLLLQIFKKASESKQTLRWVLTWVKYNLQAKISILKKHIPPIYHTDKRSVYL